MAVRVPYNDAARRGGCFGRRRHLGGYESRFLLTQSRGKILKSVNCKTCVPKHEIACSRIPRQWTPTRWGDVFKELDAGSTLRSQRGDAEPSAKHLIQVFLFRAVVLSATGDTHPEQISVKREAPLRVADDDGGVVDAEEEVGRRLLPLWAAFTGREPDDFEDM